MILTLFHKGDSLQFALKGEFLSGYTVNVSHDLDNTAGRTHPAVLKWQGSVIDDLDISLFLAVGALTSDPINNAIQTSNELLAVVSKLHDWALPPTAQGNIPDTYIESIDIFVGNGKQYWYHRRGVISHIKATFKEPWDVDNEGKPMVCEISLGVKIHLVSSTAGTREKGLALVNQKKLPRRDWKFDKMW